jgi:rSAM/selenodomain-associated transferase 2
VLTKVQLLRISVIIPMLNEAANIGRALASTRGISNVEVIAVDGQSYDGTAKLAKSYDGVKVITSAPGRAHQMNAGAKAATGKIFLFLHADTILPKGFDDHVRRIVNQPGTAAGAFGLRLFPKSPATRIIELGINLRSKYLQMPYGDQAIFLKADTFYDINGFPDIPIMEDYELVWRLRRRGRIVLAPASITTSTRRWKHLGIWQTTLINQAAIAAYCLGASPSRIARWYRPGRACRVGPGAE